MLLQASRLSSMSSEVGLAVGTRVMYIHALVDAARNQAAPKPAAKESDQKTRNISDQTGRGFGLRVNLGMAAGADHVRCLWSNRDDGGYDGRSGRLLNCGREWTGRGDPSHCLCVTGWGRRLGYESINWWGLFVHHISMHIENMAWTA